MPFIELIGHVNEHGDLEFPKPTNLLPADVRIIIETFNAEAEAADEALWQEQFANSPEILDYLEKKGLEAFQTGELEDLDIDSDLDDYDKLLKR
ncbi:MAG: hypothetical protein ACYDBJ_01510 [Aggregatilineales bacterium]